MCSPKLSFLMDKWKNIFYKDGIQSHETLADIFSINEDKMLKVDYDWTTKTMDIYGENEEQNFGCSFMPMPMHYLTAENFIKEKVGTKKKLKVWLDKNWNDKKIRLESKNILNKEGQSKYSRLLNKKKWDLDILKNLFDIHPNKAWC